MTRLPSFVEQAAEMIIDTVFRELLQNSDDAQAKQVEIRFLSKSAVNRNSGGVRLCNKKDTGKASLPDLKTEIVSTP